MAKGITAANTKAKNQAMAAQMAKDGVKRTTMRDPITTRMVSIAAFPYMVGKLPKNMIDHSGPRIKG